MTNMFLLLGYSSASSFRILHVRLEIEAKFPPPPSACMNDGIVAECCVGRADCRSTCCEEEIVSGDSDRTGQCRTESGWKRGRTC